MAENWGQHWIHSAAKVMFMFTVVTSPIS